MSAAAALKKAVKVIGSQRALGQLIGVSQPSVWAWLQREKPLPAEHVLVVERATGISRHDLRPDLYPREQVPSPAGRTVAGAPPIAAGNRRGILPIGEMVP